jgi:transcriptional regulator with GAF, ATPase, and Fis domain
MIERLARTDTTILLYGETGTGKELAAETIHALSTRASGPLVRVNSAGLPDGILESELFGHVKGAFTGASRDRKGCFEAADGGILFLDEVGDISQATQVRLLRVLDERRVVRVGSNQMRPVDARVITATNKNLAAEVASSRFRADLFYRLNVVTLRLPPLRERREDIPLLVEYFIRHFNAHFAHRIDGITEGALSELMRRPWPGNVRELKNTIERAFIYAQETVIDSKALATDEPVAPTWPDVERRKPDSRPGGPQAPISCSDLIQTAMPHYPLQIETPQMDAALLVRVLEQHRWHLGRAAAALNIHRTTLWRHMRQYGLIRRPC